MPSSPPLSKESISSPLELSEKTEDTNISPTPASDIPNGGLNAYLQVFGAHILFFNSWGILNTFGVYQEYYETSILSESTSSAISWIGTIQGFLLFFVCLIAGPLFDRGYFRYIIATGTFLVVFGMMMTSLANSYYQILLAQGICVGLGVGCLFLPSLAIVATYFTSKRALMTGITAAGGSIGGVIYPIVFRKLQPIIGFGWATRVIGFITLGLLCISLALMRMRTPPPKHARAILDLKAFEEAPFNIYSFAAFLAFIGLYFPFFYAPIYGSRVAGLSEDVSFYLLPVLNASSIFGRILPGLIATKVGPLNAMIPCSIITSILAFAWLGISSAAGLWVFCVLYGFFSGAFITLAPTILVFLCPDMSLVGTRMGMSWIFAGFGYLIGNPIAGAIVNVHEGKFHGAEVFSATTQLGGAFMFVFLRLIVMRNSKGWKA